MNFNIDLKNIDLKNITMDDIKAKLQKVEKKYKPIIDIEKELKTIKKQINTT